MQIVYDIEQGTEEWEDLHAGIITGSRAKDIITPKKLQLSASARAMVDTLVSETITGIWNKKTEFLSAAMVRGHEDEPKAITLYEKKMKKRAVRPGFLKPDDGDELSGIFGYSPDAVVDRDGDDFIGGIEVKSFAFHLYISACLENTIPKNHSLQLASFFLVNPKMEYIDCIACCFECEVMPIHTTRVMRCDLEDEIKALRDALIKIKGMVASRLDEFEALTF